MKKSTIIIVLLGVIGLIATPVFGQLDSLLIDDIVNVGVSAVDLIEPRIVDGIPNSAIGGIIASVVLAVIRFFERRRLVKKQKELQEQANFNATGKRDYG